MFIGYDNEISRELVSKISEFYQVEFIEVGQFESFKDLFDYSEQSRLVFVNLLDVRKSTDLALQVKEVFPNATLIGLQFSDSPPTGYLESQKLYGRFLNIFNLRNTLPDIIKSAG